jgi:hypothetical protein
MEVEKGVGVIRLREKEIRFDCALKGFKDSLEI